MSSDRNIDDRLQPLLSAMLDGEPTDQQIAELRRLLRDVPEARRQYFRLLAAHAVMKWSYALPGTLAGDPPAVGDDDRRADRAEHVSPPDSSTAGLAPLGPPGVVPVVLGPAGWGSLAGVLFSYLIAAMVGGAGVLAAWAWQASHDREVHVAALRARAAQQARQDSPALAPGAVVGKITRLTSRAWGGHLALGDPVALGNLIAVSDGLVEITFNNGARVMLQPPAVFTVDYPDGGFLLFGKLGALAANPRNAAGRQGAARTAPTAARQSFCICTPSALVTSPGAEISLAVERSGTSQVYVFRGAAVVEPAPGGHSFLIEQRSWAIAQFGADGWGRLAISAGAPPANLARQAPWPQPDTYSAKDNSKR